MQNNGPQSTAEVIRRAAALIVDRLPNGWTSVPGAEREGFADAEIDSAADAALFITAPDGKEITFIIEGKTVVERREVYRIAERMRLISGPRDVPVLAARYLSPPVREAITEQGISYIDATGNIRITAESPAIYMSDRGEDRDPWRGVGRPRGTLKGDPAARVVRTLLDYLQREGHVEKQGDEYLVANWEMLLRDWSKDSPLLTTSRVAQFLEPRGVEAVETRLSSGLEQKYAVTGSLAAQEWVQYAPTKAAYIYVPSIASAAAEWGLRPNTTAPNVILVEPKKPNNVVFENTKKGVQGVTFAAITQVACDLLNGPGREPAEGEALIEWMKNNESEWRRG